jgi:HEAT repeat protein
VIRFHLTLIAGLLLIGSARAADPPKVADLVRQLETGNPGKRVIAAEHLGDLEPAAVEAIPALTRTARAAHRTMKEGDAARRHASQHLYTAALDALVGIGPKSVPALADLLPGEKDDSFGRIAGDLRSFGRDAAPAVPALAKLLDDENQDFRVVVAGILEALGPGAEPAIPELINLYFNPKNKNDNRWGSGSMPPSPRVAAVRALVRIGPKGARAITEKVLPALIEELAADEFRPGGSPKDILLILGTQGETCVPAVVAAAQKKEDRVLYWDDAGEALLGLGAAGHREFGELLTSKDIEVRRKLVSALGTYLWREYFPTYYRFRPPSLDITPFVPALILALKDPDPEHRFAAADVLSHRGDKVPREAVDAVAALFTDPEVKKLVEAKGGPLHEPRFEYFGEAGARALLVLLDSDSTAVRKLAVRQLYSRQWAARVLPRLRKLTDDPDPELALAAAYHAALLSLDPKDAAPLVARRFIRSPDPEIRTSAANHLDSLEALGVPYHEALIPLLDDKDEKVVQAAAHAIYYHAPKGSPAARALAERKLAPDATFRFVPVPAPDPTQKSPGVPELMKLLTAGADERRVTAALDLGDTGAAAKPAVPALKGLLSDPDPALRFAAGYALARIENDLPALRKLLTGELQRLVRGRPITWAAGMAFERLPPDFPELVPLIARWLEIWPESTVLMNGLRKYGPKAKDAVPALRKVLRGPELPGHGYWGFERKPACEVLAAIGPDARAALPELRRYLNSVDIALALAARDAIRAIEGKR